MQRIEIHNFGPIKDATIEIPKFLLLIGEQASGKSTVAKLIYFFKSLQAGFVNNILLTPASKSFSSKNNFENPSKVDFLRYFGSPAPLDNYHITYYYTEKNYITIKWEKPLFSLSLSPDFFSQSFKKRLRSIRKKYQDTLKSSLSVFNSPEYAKEISDLTNDCFGLFEGDLFYIVADRSSTVSFGHLFERVFSRGLENSLFHNSKKRIQTIEEILLMQFLDRVALLKDYFEKSNMTKQENPFIKWIFQNMSEILKGNYTLQYGNERITWGDKSGNSVYLRNASSGQQEVIRILQDIVWVVQHDGKSSRIVEEPESHLFPLAQKKLIELLSAMIKGGKDNSLIITTHSPYILSSINNLLFAHQVSIRFPELQESIQKITNQYAWINPRDFRAYALLKKDRKVNCQSILDTQTGMIAQNYLDSVSEELSTEFNQIYKLFLSKLKENK
ncbi:AAA family ATPase [uncultured Parabacteroides sp.]|uniref:AAA family ATPase n=1 Tax=uncultured Parabacteroides sp. TaxID=512312 RepID=UPI00259BA21D|nr:AAA family ATPase [uncultured Parabacteroides sp.]